MDFAADAELVTVFSQPFGRVMRQSFNVQRIPRLIALCSLAVTVVAGTDVPTFEVTSVKAGAFDANGSSYRSTPGGRLAVSNKEPGEIFVVDHTERPSEN